MAASTILRQFWASSVLAGSLCITPMLERDIPCYIPEVPSWLELADTAGCQPAAPHKASGFESQ